MKCYPYIIGLLAICLASAATAVNPHRVQIRVNSTAPGGHVYVAAYDSPVAFERDNFVDSVIVGLGRRRDATLNLQLPHTGRYVLAAYQDLNGNGTMDTNLFGIPTEPYGFSEVPPSKWRSPDFSEIATHVADDQSETVDIKLRYWREY